MSFLDDEKLNKNDTPADGKVELDDLFKDDDFAGFDRLTATLHFEFSDILNAIEHIDEQPAPQEEAEEEPVEETAEEPAETVQEEISEPMAEEAPVPEEDATEAVAGTEDTPEEVQAVEEPATEEPAAEPAEPEEKLPKESLLSRIRRQDKGTKKLMMADVILLAVILASIITGLCVANSLVKEANAASQEKIDTLTAEVETVDLTAGVYDYAKDQVYEDIAVPTYTLEELYALDLREPTGFTADDLALITKKGLVGCEEAFVKAEETYGVNAIFLISIASLESAHGTQMFRPNNMFGYGRTGFSSKEECIMTVASGLGNKYLNPSGSLYGGSPTLKGVNKRYAANPQWYYKVGKYMQGYYQDLADAKNGKLDKFE